jgi:hypothetical protein
VTFEISSWGWTAGVWQKDISRQQAQQQLWLGLCIFWMENSKVTSKLDPKQGRQVVKSGCVVADSVSAF